MSVPSVDVLLEGYFEWTGLNVFRASSTVTLVRQDELIVVVDTGSYTRREELISALARHGYSPDDVTHLVLTHFHPDHFENSSLFTRAKRIATYGEQIRDEYRINPATYMFKRYVLTPQITVSAVPGHTKESIVVLVETERGRVAITGDLFVKKLHERTLVLHSHVGQWWHRRRIARWADYIIPGHGPEFSVE